MLQANAGYVKQHDRIYQEAPLWYIQNTRSNFLAENDPLYSISASSYAM